jgi:hypothetical protein
VRDNFFHPQLGQVCELGEGVQGWRGYHSSVRPTGLGLTLNLGESFQMLFFLTLLLCMYCLTVVLNFNKLYAL